MARIVLVADDSPTIQKRALGILKSEGFEVETVSNGVAAIKRLAVLHPVVILADVSMPGRDGYEVCEFVKKSAELSHVPVLLVASEMEPYDQARGAEVGADGIVKKPFEAHDLIDIVEKFADQCEASIAQLAGPPVNMPEPLLEPAPEIAPLHENPAEMPTGVQHVAPAFSAVSEGIAFSLPVEEETPHPPLPQETPVQFGELPLETVIHPEPAPAPEFVGKIPSPEPQTVPATEAPSAGEEPPAPSAHGLTSSPVVSSAPYSEGVKSALTEPIFIEEQPPQPSHPHPHAAELPATIFHAPPEIAEPVWKDETIPAPPEPEPVPPAVTAMSLDSFTLEDATAGQVHFAPGSAEAAPLEFAYPASSEEVPSTEFDFSKVAAEVPPAPVEASLPQTPVEATFPETAFTAAPLDASLAEIPLQEAVPETASPQAVPQEAVPQAPSSKTHAEAAQAAPRHYDWALIYSVVHKVVVRMSPPPLPMEAVEEMAKRLAFEIATEISSESSPPPK